MILNFIIKHSRIHLFINIVFLYCLISFKINYGFEINDLHDFPLNV